jgi:16S rRNA (guanine966-N2)-methyltransferase
VIGARFLDLFAGSGAYGLEALSRGAVGGSFVESNSRALACLRGNISAVCKCLGRAEGDLAVRQGDARTAPMGGSGVPDLVFIDPPYELIAEAALPLFGRLSEALSTEPEALVVFEMPGETELAPPGWTVVKRLERGARQPTASIFRRA